MTQEENYRSLKKAAQEAMASDYQWLLEHAPPSQWLGTRQWLAEFVYDVNIRLAPRDELLRPIPLRVLYERMFSALGLPMLKHPSKTLSKLHATEHRKRIEPDYVTLFYMRHLPVSPTRRIIEILLNPK